eukprot:4191850-Pyramimonas_sp.AAC.1
MNYEEVSGGRPLPMGPADYVTNPSGSSNSRNCRHLWALALPERHSQATFRMPGANCRPFRVFRVPRTPGMPARAPSLWGPQIMLPIRAGHRKTVTVVTFGPLRLEFGGSIRREPRL